MVLRTLAVGCAFAAAPGSERNRSREVGMETLMGLKTVVRFARELLERVPGTTAAPARSRLNSRRRFTRLLPRAARNALTGASTPEQ